MSSPEATYKHRTYGEIEVLYSDDLDGGGWEPWGQALIPFVRNQIGAVDSAMEWCAGPGFIGFSLLSRGLCRSLTLADINPSAVDAAKATIERNQLQESVEVYLSDCFDAVPAGQKWDLIVGNPPHFGDREFRPRIQRPPLIYQDDGWKIHQRFFEQAGEYLNTDASIALVERADHAKPELFREMIEASPHLRWAGATKVSPNFFVVWARRD